MEKLRCLITVQNGVVDVIADEGVDVRVYDFDVDEPAVLPAHFDDLASSMGVPKE